MGTIELGLLLKFGVPLAVKLLTAGKTETETVIEVSHAIAGMSETNVGEVLLLADEQQSKSIIDGLFGLITGVANAFGNLINAFVGILK